MTAEAFPLEGLRLTQEEIDLAHKALDAIELMASDASQSVLDHRSDDVRRSLERDPESLQTMRASVIAAALLLGLREIAQAVRARGAD